MAEGAKVKTERDTKTRRIYFRSWNATVWLGGAFILSGLAGLALLAWLFRGCR